MSDDFKPCPFCGGTDIRCTNHGKISRDPFHRNDDVWSMCCYTCGATFPNRYQRELLVEAWNSRVLGEKDTKSLLTDEERHALIKRLANENEGLRAALKQARRALRREFSNE